MSEKYDLVAVPDWSLRIGHSSHRLQSVGPATRLYDENGNTAKTDGASRSGPTLTYNQANRFTRYDYANNTKFATYDYTARGERVRKSDQTGKIVYYMYDQSGHLIGEYDAQGVATTEYFWLDDIPVAAVVNGVVHYIESDHFGSPRRATNSATGAQSWSWDFFGSPFGENPAASFGLTLNLRFPGQYFDLESGMHYNYYRDYEPGTSRCAESDPVGLAGGLATYAYADGNPLGVYDPLGLTGGSPNRSFSPGGGGNSADRKKATKKFQRDAADRGEPPPDLEPKRPKPEDPLPPPANGKLDAVQQTCSNLAATGFDFCGPGPALTTKCEEWDCDLKDVPDPNMDACLANPPVDPRKSIRHDVAPPGYSKARDDKCRCVYGSLYEKY